MHEQLIFPNNPKLKIAISVIGMLIFPLSMMNFNIVNDRLTFSFAFDLVTFVASLLLGLCPFVKLKSQHYLNFPFLSVLILCFLRFGKVSILGVKIPFDSYIISAFYMFGAFFICFFLYFIAEGKIRSRLPLILWPCILFLITAFSYIFGLPPFVSYDRITEGNICISISRTIQFVLLFTEPILIASGLKSDGISVNIPKKSQRE